MREPNVSRAHFSEPVGCHVMTGPEYEDFSVSTKTTAGLAYTLDFKSSRLSFLDNLIKTEMTDSTQECYTHRSNV